MEIRAADLRVGDRMAHPPRWTVETVCVSPTSGLVVAVGQDGKGDRFALNRRPHDPVLVVRP